MPHRWRFDYRPSSALPPLAWVARVRGRDVSVDCGTSVRCEVGGFFEGTWVGPPGVGSVLESTAPFGTGMVARGPDLFAIPPGHTMALLFSWRRNGELFIANTLVGLLTKTGLELLPDADYQGLFARTHMASGRLRQHCRPPAGRPSTTSSRTCASCPTHASRSRPSRARSRSPRSTTTSSGSTRPCLGARQRARL